MATFTTERFADLPELQQQSTTVKKAAGGAAIVQAAAKGVEQLANVVAGKRQEQFIEQTSSIFKGEIETAFQVAKQETLESRDLSFLVGKPKLLAAAIVRESEGNLKLDDPTVLRAVEVFQNLAIKQASGKGSIVAHIRTLAQVRMKELINESPMLTDEIRQAAVASLGFDPTGASTAEAFGILNQSEKSGPNAGKTEKQMIREGDIKALRSFKSNPENVGASVFEGKSTDDQLLLMNRIIRKKGRLAADLGDQEEKIAKGNFTTNTLANTTRLVIGAVFDQYAHQAVNNLKLGEDGLVETQKLKGLIRAKLGGIANNFAIQASGQGGSQKDISIALADFDKQTETLISMLDDADYLKIMAERRDTVASLSEDLLFESASFVMLVNAAKHDGVLNFLGTMSGIGSDEIMLKVVTTLNPELAALKSFGELGTKLAALQVKLYEGSLIQPTEEEKALLVLHQYGVNKAAPDNPDAGMRTDQTSGIIGADKTLSAFDSVHALSGVLQNEKQKKSFNRLMNNQMVQILPGLLKGMESLGSTVTITDKGTKKSVNPRGRGEASEYKGLTLTTPKREGRGVSNLSSSAHSELSDSVDQIERVMKLAKRYMPVGALEIDGISDYDQFIESIQEALRTGEYKSGDIKAKDESKDSKSKE